MRLLKTPTPVHEADDVGTSAYGTGRSLVVAGSPSVLDDASIKGGSGDRGGIAPEAPGFGTVSSGSTRGLAQDLEIDRP